MKKFNDLIIEKKKENQYEYKFDGNLGYVINKENNMIIVYSQHEPGQKYLKESVDKMNSKKSN